MPQRRLLLVDASHLGVSLWHGGILREEGHFRHDETGHAAFAEHVSRHRGSIFYLLADIAEESYQTETLPFTRGSDRAILLKRKLGQHYHGSLLATAVSCGREKSGRRDERFLFAALLRPQLFEPWLAVLRAAEARLAGIHSLPLLGPVLLARLPPAGERCLLMAVTRAGIRQSFFENGRLKFSRLKTTRSTDSADLAAACAAEAAKIHQYQLGQRQLTRGTPLPVVVLVHPAQLDIFQEHCRDTGELRFTLQDLHAAGKACGLKTLPPDSRSENLFLHLLAKHAPREQFAPAGERRFHRLWQLRSGLLTGGAAVLLTSLLLAGYTLMAALETRSAIDTLQQQTAADSNKYAALQQTLPPMPTDPDKLRAVVTRFEALEKRSDTPVTLYRAISHALDAMPGVDIERIQWQHGSPADGPALEAKAVIHGLLPASMATDRRGQLETVNAFAAELQKDPALSVIVQRMPFDIESGKPLKSRGQYETEGSEMKFVIEISRKP